MEVLKSQLELVYLSLTQSLELLDLPLECSVVLFKGYQLIPLLVDYGLKLALQLSVLLCGARVGRSQAVSRLGEFLQEDLFILFELVDSGLKT